jgi:hypothetical protein
MHTMSSPSAESRAVSEHRIPATKLRAGDLINTSPGAGNEEDWQQVQSVHTAENPGSDADIATLIGQIGDRYVVVRMTDVAPVDSPVYFENGAALAFDADGGDDPQVSEVVSDADASRTFLFTRFELVTVRG